MFKVGDVAILINAVNLEAKKFIGQECTILGWHMENREWIVDFPPPIGGGQWTCCSEFLMKKPDHYDGNTLVSWNDIPYYRPKELVT